MVLVVILFFFRDTLSICYHTKQWQKPKKKKKKRKHPDWFWFQVYRQAGLGQGETLNSKPLVVGRKANNSNLKKTLSAAKTTVHH